jgi:hypothetical protein
VFINQNKSPLLRGDLGVCIPSEGWFDRLEEQDQLIQELLIRVKKLER